MASNAVGGGAVDAEGFLKFLLHFYKTGYTRALNVTQRAAGANMSVDVNIDSDGYGGALFVTASAVPYFGYTNAAINSTVTTADPTNPRKDIVVAYIDLSLITIGTTNNLGALRIKVVPGTAAASPVDPSGATIQASIGAGFPYVSLGRLAVAAAAPSIVNAVITDLRTPAANAMPYLWGGALNTVGHRVPNQADGTVVTTTDVASIITAMLTDLSVTNAKLAANTAWASYTPTWSGTLGTSTITGKYQQVGKTVYCRITLTLAAGFVAPTGWTFTLPVTAHADYASGSGVNTPVGHARMSDTGTQGSYTALVALSDATHAALYSFDAGVARLIYANITAIDPHTWAATDFVNLQFSYEAA